MYVCVLASIGGMAGGKPDRDDGGADRLCPTDAAKLYKEGLKLCADHAYGKALPVRYCMNGDDDPPQKCYMHERTRSSPAFIVHRLPLSSSILIQVLDNAYELV